MSLARNILAFGSAPLTRHLSRPSPEAGPASRAWAAVTALARTNPQAALIISLLCHVAKFQLNTH
jgi:hypothetical protein